MIGSLQHLLHLLINVKGLIEWGGTLLVCIIVFIETGFFVGFFLPGYSLLVTAGIFAAAEVVPLRWLFLPVMACAIVGDQIGYWIGRAAGPALYKREDSLFFRRSHLQKAHDFYEKYGGRAVIFSRVVAIIRTFCSPVAGGALMAYSRYVMVGIFGRVCLVCAMILCGYFLWRSVADIRPRI